MTLEVAELEQLNQLILELDRQSQHMAAAGETARKHHVARRHPRYPYRVDCIIRLFSGGSDRLFELPGRTRNISRSGVGVIVRRVIGPNEPVEVEIDRGATGKFYMAGAARFCRYVGMGYHEVGIVMKMAGGAPMLPKTWHAAQGVLNWLQAATPH